MPPSTSSTFLSRVLPSGAYELAGRWVDRIAYGALVLLAFLLPFDLLPDSPLWPDALPSPVRLAGIVTAVLAIAAHALARPARRGLPAFEVALPSLLFVVAALLSAATATEHQRASVLYALHVAEGLGVMAAVAVTVRGRNRREVLLTALLAGAAAFATVGLVDVAASRGLEPLLSSFHTLVTNAAPPRELRGTLDSGGEAGVILAPAAAMAAAWYLAARDRISAAGAYVLVILFVAAALRTLTAVSWVALAVSIGGVCLLVVEASPWRRGAIALTLPIVGVLLYAAEPEAASRPFSRPALRVYGAIVQPWASELTLRPGRAYRLPVVLTNTGTFAWGAVGEQPVSVGIRWFDATSGALLAEAPHAVPLPAIPAGEQASTRVVLAVPQMMEPLILAIDVVEDDRVWYERMTTSAAVLRCSPVDEDLLHCRGGTDEDRLVVRRAAGPPPVPDPSDRRLRQAALRMVQKSPLLGEGPDGFRHAYWRFAPTESRDDRARLDNVFLQLAAELGLVGLGVVLWLTLAVLWRLWIALHRCRSAGDRLLAGVLLAACAAVVAQSAGASFAQSSGLVHLVWILVGLAAALDVPPPLVVTPLPTPQGPPRP